MIRRLRALPFPHTDRADDCLRAGAYLAALLIAGVAVNALAILARMAGAFDFFQEVIR